MTHSVGQTFSQNFSSLALPVWDWQCLEDLEEKDNSVSNGGDCRTAPATPGLLTINISAVNNHSQIVLIKLFFGSGLIELLRKNAGKKKEKELLS